MSPTIRRNTLHRSILWLLLLTAFPTYASVIQGGSIKVTAIGYALDDRNSSLQYGAVGSLSGRYTLETQGDNGLSFQMHYQLGAQYLGGVGGSQLSYLLGSGTATDQTRYFNLTRVISQTSQGSVVHRIDRLNIGYSGDNLVWRIGRQAVGWGNGFTFQVLDFFNPIAPGSLDSDYKVGDDMFYMQWLTQRGNDWQLAWVLRRDAMGQVSGQESTLAWKFHWVTEGGDYDLLVSQHYGQAMAGWGMAKNIGGWVLRADMLYHDLSNPDDRQYVINTDFAGEWWSKSYHIFIEYFHNSAAQGQIDYGTLPLSILQRLGRGELYVMGRDYLGLGWMVQTTPLSSVNLNAIYNMDDNSALLTAAYVSDLRQNLQFQAGMMISVGKANSEFGGLWDSGTASYLPTADMLFAQFAHYF